MGGVRGANGLTTPFETVGELMGCVQSLELGAGAPRLLRFILLRTFSDTSLVVWILDIVYDCHLKSVLQSLRG